jgi:hypothetical protein
MAGDLTFESAMTAFFEYQMKNMYTAIPAKVMQVRDAKQCKVDAKPLVDMVFSDLETLEWATIPNVPIMYPSSSTSAITFPVNAGDIVLLVFSQAGLDVFKSGDGTPQPASDYRAFNMRDAIAIPGLFPFGMAINQQSKRTLTHSTDDVVVAHNLGTPEECEIRLKPTGKVEINGSQIDISSSTKIGGNLINTGSVTVGVGATGSFTTPLGQIVTVTDGIITNII